MCKVPVERVLRIKLLKLSNSPVVVKAWPFGCLRLNPGSEPWGGLGESFSPLGLSTWMTSSLSLASRGFWASDSLDGDSIFPVWLAVRGEIQKSSGLLASAHDKQT